MIKQFLVCGLVLFGNTSNSIGRVGIRCSQGGYIHHVYRHSPASGILYEGDIVLEADGYKGISHVDGTNNQSVTLKIKRCRNILTFTLIRVPKEEIKN